MTAEFPTTNDLPWTHSRDNTIHHLCYHSPYSQPRYLRSKALKSLEPLAYNVLRSGFVRQAVFLRILDGNLNF